VRTIRFEVRLDASLVKELATTGLVAEGFQVTWRDERRAVAEQRPSFRKVLLFGAHVRYLRVDVTVLTKDDRTVLEFARPAIEWVGGPIAAWRSAATMERVLSRFEDAFDAEKVLLAVSEE
jgi:hypothetical protein